MKSKEEIERLAFLEYPRLINDPYNPMEDDNTYERKIWIGAYTQCQEDMADKKYTIKEVERYHDMLSFVRKQTPKDRLETELMAKKYTEEDIRKVIDETIKACNISQKKSYGDLEIDTDKIINSLNKRLI